ncbi:MAG: class II glutamine amidotransferase [Deltaproteobacteria bacterium]|nr:class II glutamine amidotransferase [Deltaproteobacteria bacterium]
MCELLGMSALHPTDVNQSLALLRPRGGEIGPHADGWGLAFYEGRAARVFKEPVPAAESRCLAFISEYDFRSTVVVGHIRKANPSAFGRASANTHPFSRELGGRSWVFAHNGKVPGVRDDKRFVLGRFQPIGETDSEHAFCFLLEQIAHASGGRLLGAAELEEALRRPVELLNEMGELNFLLSDGVHLVAFANTRLHHVHRTCVVGACQQRVSLLATVPLTEEPWHPLEVNHLYVFRGGEVVDRSEAAERPTDRSELADHDATTPMHPGADRAQALQG